VELNEIQPTLIQGESPRANPVALRARATLVNRTTSKDHIEKERPFMAAERH
jgi:hypothetical protein